MSEIVKKLGNKNVRGVVVSKTQQIPLTKQFTVNPTTTPPATAQLIAPAILGSFDDSSDVRIRIDSIYSKQDIGKNNSCARIPLYTWNNTTPHTVKYSQASPPIGVAWSNIKPPNWSDMVDYLNENHSWSKSNAYLQDSLNIGYALSAWSASNHYQIDGTPYGSEQSVAHSSVFVTNFSGHTSDSRINALFECKVKAFNTNQYNSVYYNIEPYTYGEGVKIDFKDNTSPKVTVGFEGILSGTGLDSMINEYSQDTVKSMFVVGFKGGWTSAGGDTHYASYGYLRNKIYSLQDGNPFTITKRKLRDNVWYFESKDHVTFEDRETVQHTKGEDVPEIDLHRNQIVAFPQNGFTGMDPYILAWYIGPTAASEITFDTSTDNDYRYWTTFSTLFKKEYTDENTWQNEDIAKFPTTASMKAVLDKITAYFATAPSTGIIHTFPNGSTWVVPCFSTDNILYEAQEDVPYYQAPVPPNDYVEYEDLCLNQPMFFMTTGYPSYNSTGTCFSNNDIYYLSAVNPKPAWMDADPGYYLYCGSKDHFDSEASAWIKITESSSARDLNKATLFYKDLGEYESATAIAKEIRDNHYADYADTNALLRNYKPSFNILNFPWGTNAQWLALNYTFSCK